MSSDGKKCAVKVYPAPKTDIEVIPKTAIKFGSFSAIF
jgi:hypothetical protein